jgi:hypothetical protein
MATLSNTSRSGSSGKRDDLRRIAVYIDEHADKTGLAGRCDQRLHHVPARPHRIALLRCGENLVHSAFLDAAPPHFERRVARDEIIAYRLGHA